MKAKKMMSSLLAFCMLIGMAAIIPLEVRADGGVSISPASDTLTLDEKKPA